MSLRRQAPLYLLAGGAQFVLDWSVFVALTHLGLLVAPSNLCSRTCGACLGFWLNGRYTFARDGQPQLHGKALLKFVAMWLLLTALSTTLMVAVEHHLNLQYAWLAKPIVEGFCAVLGFLGSRHFVYR